MSSSRRKPDLNEPLSFEQALNSLRSYNTINAVPVALIRVIHGIMKQEGVSMEIAVNAMKQQFLTDSREAITAKLQSTPPRPSSGETPRNRQKKWDLNFEE